MSTSSESFSGEGHLNTLRQEIPSSSSTSAGTPVAHQGFPCSHLSLWGLDAAQGMELTPACSVGRALRGRDGSSSSSFPRNIYCLYVCTDSHSISSLEIIGLRGWGNTKGKGDWMMKSQSHKWTEVKGSNEVPHHQSQSRGCHLETQDWVLVTPNFFLNSKNST